MNWIDNAAVLQSFLLLLFLALLLAKLVSAFFSDHDLQSVLRIAVVGLLALIGLFGFVLEDWAKR